ncbi:MAG: hypothetical protein JWM85_1230 [Acidimicrobiaceae bacterium]|nr:hypothetical protein [Acidimicrobiaceae bacterium]
MPANPSIERPPLLQEMNLCGNCGLQIFRIVIKLALDDNGYPVAALGASQWEHATGRKECEPTAVAHFSR